MIWLNLIKLLIGFVLAMLGIIIALHTTHVVPGLLVSVAGAMAVLTSLPAERI